MYELDYFHVPDDDGSVGGGDGLSAVGATSPVSMDGGSVPDGVPLMLVTSEAGQGKSTLLSQVGSQLKQVITNCEIVILFGTTFFYGITNLHYKRNKYYLHIHTTY